jgi:hypothetical protein
VKFLENVSRIGKAVVGQHHSGVRDAIDSALDLGGGFGASIVGILNFTEVGDQRLEQLAP